MNKIRCSTDILKGICQHNHYQIEKKNHDSLKMILKSFDLNITLFDQRLFHNV